VLAVRAVHPDVDEVGGGTQQARQAGAAHHAVSGVVRGEQREDLLAVPAQVPELDRDAYPVRDPREEVAEPGVVAGLGGRQLHEQHRPASVQFVPARRDALQPGLSGASSLRAWVRPRGALTESRKPSGRRRRQLANAAGAGQR
jgi:hypothetical protein